MREDTKTSRRFPAMLLALGCAAASAQPPPSFPNAHDSDPARLGWMLGSPPPADRIIRQEDGSMYRFPQLRWTFSNARQFGPTATVSRGIGAPVTLPRAEREDIDAVRFTPLGSEQSMSWREAFDANYTDGLVVLHRGRIVYERYAGVFGPERQHMAQSVTKSFYGTLAAMLVAEGKLDQDAPVTQYVPELKHSAFGDATVRQVMDMRTGLKYHEDYADPSSEIWAYVRAGHVMARPPGYQGPTSFYEYLQTVQKQGEHGGAFAYKTINTDVLGWIIRRVSGQSIRELLSERIWKPLGMEQDAFFTVDAIGIEFAGGGLNTGLRDLARFGELMRRGGEWQGRQIIPRAAVELIQRGGDRAAFAPAGYVTLPGWSYRAMWWVSHNAHGAYMARGIHGQSIYVDPKAEMVIARYASYPVAPNPVNDPTTLPAYQALAEHLMAQP